jgi:lipopolysaccharide kinase (Kdo/WaaP) family protein
VAPISDYEIRRDGKWKLLVRPASWSPELWAEILHHVRAAEWQKHPQTLRLAGVGGIEAAYLKIYSPPSRVALVKDRVRDSKALGALKQSEALAALGFHVPPPVAAGEERRAGTLGRAFLLTREIAAEPLATVLQERFAPPLDRAAVRTKRRWLERLAGEIQSFHRRGFVHGDLVASNIFVAVGREGDPIFFYMDHDRTRRYPGWLPTRLWRRNLVQLNRFLLPGISARDRVRFLKYYLSAAARVESRHRLSRSLARETRRRYGARMMPPRSRRAV